MVVCETPIEIKTIFPSGDGVPEAIPRNHLSARDRHAGGFVPSWANAGAVRVESTQHAFERPGAEIAQGHLADRGLALVRPGSIEAPRGEERDDGRAEEATDPRVVSFHVRSMPHLASASVPKSYLRCR
jgi:hypothetical protein